MKSCIKTLIVFCLLSVCCKALAIPRDSVIRTSIFSTILNEKRDVIVHLPREYFYNNTQRFPVMYVLDGTSHDQHTTDKIEVLSSAGLMPAAIVVAIPNTRGNRNRDYVPPFMRTNIDDTNSVYGASHNFLAFFKKELIPFVDSGYRSSDIRTISGNSAGGLFVLYSLYEEPSLFQARFCYSTPVWRFDSLMVKKMKEFLKVNKPDGFLYMSVGENETERIKGGFNLMVATMKANPKKNFKWAADLTPHCDHQENALISTSKALVEWGKYLSQKKK